MLAVAGSRVAPRGISRKEIVGKIEDEIREKLDRDFLRQFDNWTLYNAMRAVQAGRSHFVLTRWHEWVEEQLALPL